LAEPLALKELSGPTVIGYHEVKPMKVAVLMDVPDMDTVQAALETQEMADAIAHTVCCPRRW
jgi:hypothetical protein